MAFKRLAVGGPLLTSQAKIPLGNESGNSLSDACPWQWCAKTNQCRRVVGAAQGYTQGLEDSNCSARRPETGHPNPADSLMRTAGRVRHSRIYARWPLPIATHSRLFRNLEPVMAYHSRSRGVDHKKSLQQEAGSVMLHSDSVQPRQPRQPSNTCCYF